MLLSIKKNTHYVWIISLGEEDWVGFTLVVDEQVRTDGDFGALGLCLGFWAGTGSVHCLWPSSKSVGSNCRQCFPGMEHRLRGLPSLLRSSLVGKGVGLL